MSETAEHLLTHCNFTEALWQCFATCHGLPSYAELIAKGGSIDWVRLLISSSKSERKMKLGLLFLS
jgi:hypothetical protein